MNNSIKEITQRFNNTLNLNQSSMPAEPNCQLLRLYVDTLPNYDGNPHHTLHIFIDNCDI